MENNGIKENYLEVLNEQEIVKTTESEVLPAMIVDRNLLLPVIIQNKVLDLVEIKTEFNNLKENKTLTALLKFMKNVIKVLAKMVRFSFIFVANAIIFAGVATTIVATIAIVTKNIVNSYYDIKPSEDTTYSIFKMKEE